MCLTFFSCSQEKLNFTLRKSFDQMFDPQVFQHCAVLRTVKLSQPSFKHHGREKKYFSRASHACTSKLLCRWHTGQGYMKGATTGEPCYKVQTLLPAPLPLSVLLYGAQIFVKWLMKQQHKTTLPSKENFLIYMLLHLTVIEQLS